MSSTRRDLLRTAFGALALYAVHGLPRGAVLVLPERVLACPADYELKTTTHNDGEWVTFRGWLRYPLPPSHGISILT